MLLSAGLDPFCTPPLSVYMLLSERLRLRFFYAFTIACTAAPALIFHIYRQKI
jgi:hypothetical protein